MNHARLFASSVLLGSAVALVALMAAPALADTLACYKAGTAAMKADDFAAAAEAFAAAAEKPTCAGVRDGLLYNEAAALDRLAAAASAGDDMPFCRALRAYRRALPVARAATRPVIEKQIAALSPRCPPAGALKIVCEPAGGTVSLEGLTRKQPCPARFDDLRPRTWRGEVTAAGITAPFEVEVRSGQRIEHRVVLDLPSPTPADPGETPGLTVGGTTTTVEPGGGPLTWIGWGAIALGAASAGVATYAYLDGRALVEEADALAADETLSRAEYDSAYAAAEADHASRKNLHLGTTIAAGALVTTGVVLLLLDDGPPAEGEARLEPIIGPVSGVRVHFWP